MGNLSGCILEEVFDQQKMDCCYAVTITAAVYAEFFLSHYQGDLEEGYSYGAEGSIQEFIDCLHWIFRPSSQSEGKLVIPKKGLANQITNGLEYMKSIGNFPAHLYGFQNELGHCREPCIKESPDIATYEVEPSESELLDKNAKIFIEDFDRVVVPKEAHLVTDKHRQKIEDRVQIQPVIGELLMTERMSKYTWTPEEDQIYVGGEEEKVYKAYEDEKKRCADEKLPPPSPPARMGKHAVLVVGFGVKNGVSYYIVKNSYGPRFGYRGYMKIKTDLVGGFHYPMRAYVATEMKPTKDGPKLRRRKNKRK